MHHKIYLKSSAKNNITKIQHPWIFSHQIKDTELPSSEIHGKVVSVFCRDEFICRAYYNSKTQIALRILSRNTEDAIDLKFFRERIRKAAGLRHEYVLSADTNACRLVYGESDGLPGFIVDKYNDSLILQVTTAGAENLKPVFLEALLDVIKPTMVYEKSPGQNRMIEGLKEKGAELLFGEFREEELITENSIKYYVNFITGQKTGFYLDQRMNRLRARNYVRNKRVLNLFSYTGGFSISSVIGGADYVHSVDSSANAIEISKRNFQINKIKEDKHEETSADVFNFLGEVETAGYDIIILDPPAFVKSNKHLKAGIKGYITLNSLALKKLPPGGLLLTSSCSGAVNQDVFSKIINWASIDSGCDVQILEKYSHAPDHPVIPNFPESEYLKFFICIKK